jgi:hypothetical protein
MLKYMHAFSDGILSLMIIAICESETAGAKKNVHQTGSYYIQDLSSTICNFCFAFRA